MIAALLWIYDDISLTSAAWKFSSLLFFFFFNSWVPEIKTLSCLPPFVGHHNLTGLLPHSLISFWVFTILQSQDLKDKKRGCELVGGLWKPLSNPTKHISSVVVGLLCFCRDHGTDDWTALSITWCEYGPITPQKEVSLNHNY